MSFGQTPYKIPFGSSNILDRLLKTQVLKHLEQTRAVEKVHMKRAITDDERQALLKKKGRKGGNASSSTSSLAASLPGQVDAWLWQLRDQDDPKKAEARAVTRALFRERAERKAERPPAPYTAHLNSRRARNRPAKVAREAVVVKALRVAKAEAWAS